MTAKIKKKIDRVSPGFGRVDQVSPGQFPSGFLPQPGPVLDPGRPAGPVRVLKHWLELANLKKKKQKL
jgi:hypothetical protein